MYKKTITILITGLFLAGVSGLSFVMMCAQAQTQEEAAKEIVDVGNTICPISGEKINEKMKETFEYEGKIYNFCCAMCIDQFKNDPEKYIKKIEEQKSKEAEQSEHSEHPGHDEGAHEHQHMH